MDTIISRSHSASLLNLSSKFPKFPNLNRFLICRQQFGDYIGNGQYLIPAYWQSLWNALAQVATMIGAICAGPITDRLGRRMAFFIAAIISFAGIAVVYTSSSPGVFLAGKMVNALALGITQTAGQVYVSEISPLRLRGILLSAYTFSMVFQPTTLVFEILIIEYRSHHCRLGCILSDYDHRRFIIQNTFCRRVGIPLRPHHRLFPHPRKSLLAGAQRIYRQSKSCTCPNAFKQRRYPSHTYRHHPPQR
jgi:Sugar (and other) transporter